MTLTLNCIHKPLFGAVEEDDSKEHNNTKKGDAVEQTTNGESTHTEATIFEGFEDGGKGIDVDECLVLDGSETQGIDDWRGIHEKLHTETDEHIQIAVLCC